MLNIKGHHPVGSRRRNFDGAERSCITGLKMQMITVTLSRTKVLEVDSVYNVNKYATDELNTVLEMISDRPR